MTTYTVPGQYPTLQAAFNALRFSHDTIIIQIQAGHRLTHGLSLLDSDYSNITITSVDPTVKLATNFSGVAESILGGVDGGSEYMRYGLVYGHNTRMPVIDVLFDMENKFEDGIYVTGNSNLNINQDKGVINAGRHGVHARSSNVWAMGLNVSGANGCGVRGQHGSRVEAMHVKANNCCKIPEIGDGSLFISRTSTGYFNEGQARNSGNIAVNNHRSWISAQGMDLRNAAVYAIRVEQGGHSIMTTCDLRNSGSHGISISSGSGVFDNCDIRGNKSGYPIHMRYGLTVSAHSINHNNRSGLTNIAKNQVTTHGIILV